MVEIIGENGDYKPDLARDLWLMRPLRDTLLQHYEMFERSINNADLTKPGTACDPAQLMGAMEVEVQSMLHILDGHTGLPQLPERGLENFVNMVALVLGAFDALEKQHHQQLKNLGGN